MTTKFAYICNVGILKEKSFGLAVAIVEFCNFLKVAKLEGVIAKQLLRAGTAVAANHREAEHAESSADFVHKLSIAQKECNETLYWLELLQATNNEVSDKISPIKELCIEVLRMLASSIKTAKARK